MEIRTLLWPPDDSYAFTYYTFRGTRIGSLWADRCAGADNVFDVRVQYPYECHINLRECGGVLENTGTAFGNPAIVEKKEII